MSLLRDPRHSWHQVRKLRQPVKLENFNWKLEKLSLLKLVLLSVWNKKANLLTPFPDSKGLLLQLEEFVEKSLLRVEILSTLKQKQLLRTGGKCLLGQKNNPVFIVCFL